MSTDFPRVLLLLRKEKGISQKEAAASLGVSQALLSHYEKGIRECGLAFVVRAADFYGVSADYLLGRSADPDGMTISAAEIPDPDATGKENNLSSVGILPVLNKKLISNSLNILFDMLAKSKNKELIKNASAYLMTAVYRMFRIVYGFSPKNNLNTFSISDPGALEAADSYMKACEVKVIRSGKDVNEDGLSLSADTLSRNYPLFSSSLFNLIKNCEDNIER